MKLERGQELYSEYRDGTLSPAMKLALEQHLQADPGARTDFEEFDSAMKILEGATFEEVEAPHGFRASVMERVAAAHAAREEAPQGFLAKLAHWFGQPHRKELTGAVAGLAAVAVVVTAVLHPTTMVNQVNTSNFALNTTRTLTTTIRSVGTENGADGNVYHNFQLHLPESVSGATVNAYVVTETAQILDPAVRDRDATPALATPIHLSNDKMMTIPVGLLKQAPSGSTLNMLVTWKADSPSQLSGSQVVFTPVGPPVADAAQKTPVSGNMFDSLQAIAAAYNVTVIADSTTAPTASAAPWNAGDSVDKALSTVATSEGYTVDKLDPNGTTYLVHISQ